MQLLRQWPGEVEKAVQGANDISGYFYNSASHNDAHSYLLPKIYEILEQFDFAGNQKVFDLGCGNGSVGGKLSSRGWEVTGVDPSKNGIAQAKSAFPHLNLNVGSAYDDLPGIYGKFPFLISLEVVEHVYNPRLYMETAYRLLDHGGVGIFSTPYHGYWKNLALAVSGKMDQHFTALWDHGHIKFWSIQTLTELMSEAGFSSIKFYRVGRIPQLAKSMIAVGRR